MNPDLYQRVRGRAYLNAAWRRVRENGLTSLSAETRDAIRVFDADAHKGLRRIQDQLREHRFIFAPQTGVAKPRPGKRPRPIVIAAVENRIVQRAILDVLQDQPAIIEVLASPNSFGGIRGKGVGDAIASVSNAISEGSAYYIRSDIQGFFERIPRGHVIDFLQAHFSNQREFLALFERAAETNLANVARLGDDAALFPLSAVGVAQGSPLSPLIGNILLREFDAKMNGRGIICVRYIDDFVLLGPSPSVLSKAFANAQAELSRFGISAYDPAANSQKASLGKVNDGFRFLGCHIKPGLLQPCRSARQSVLQAVDEALARGQKSLKRAAAMSGSRVPRQGYAQTLVEIDHILRGWRHAFAFCNGRSVFRDIDRIIDERLSHFHRWVNRLCFNQTAQVKRRVAGVFLLDDYL
ncbi:Maturase [uncultured Defluviicoccus sp.]|uniref:Maturase n=1 Tax=metagenome TaxID=256318 RepID=A0A380TJX4_9ZZZZ|nr:Maturase [uncultured Defluviicoccus sp.]